MTETFVLVVIPVGLAVALAAAMASEVLTRRTAFIVGVILLAAAVSAVTILASLDQAQRHESPFALLLLAIPLAFSFFPAATEYLSEKPLWLLVAVPISFYVGLVVAINFGMGLGVVSP